MGCFSCAFAFGSYFRVWSSYQKNRKKIKNLKNVKTKNLKLFNNPGFSSPDLGGGGSFVFSIDNQTINIYTRELCCRRVYCAMHAAVYPRSLYFCVPMHSNTSLFPKIISLLTKHTFGEGKT